MPITPDDQKRMRDARKKTLLARWLQGGRLSIPELAEIRQEIGPESYAEALAALGKSPEDDAGESATLGRAGYSKPLRDYFDTYQTKPRQLKRWIKAGREGKPSKLPPLDDPGAMLDWWTQYMPKQRPPAKILALAVEMRKKDALPAGIDISQLTTEKGQAAQTARAILAAASQKLAEAYFSGTENDIERAQRRWTSAMNANRLAEAAERAEKKSRGELIPQGDLFAELGQLLEVIRIMGETMDRKLGVELSPDQREKMRAYWHACGSVLRRLSHFQSLGEIELELSAA